MATSNDSGTLWSTEDTILRILEGRDGLHNGLRRRITDVILPYIDAIRNVSIGEMYWHEQMSRHIVDLRQFLTTPSEVFTVLSSIERELDGTRDVMFLLSESKKTGIWWSEAATTMLKDLQKHETYLLSQKEKLQSLADAISKKNQQQGSFEKTEEADIEAEASSGTKRDSVSILDDKEDAVGLKQTKEAEERVADYTTGADTSTNKPQDKEDASTITDERNVVFEIRFVYENIWATKTCRLQASSCRSQGKLFELAKEMLKDSFFQTLLGYRFAPPRFLLQETSARTRLLRKVQYMEISWKGDLAYHNWFERNIMDGSVDTLRVEIHLNTVHTTRWHQDGVHDTLYRKLLRSIESTDADNFAIVWSNHANDDSEDGIEPEERSEISWLLPSTRDFFPQREPDLV